MKLSEAITQVETTGSDYQKSVTQTATDQTAADAAQAKADAAKALVASDQQAQDAAAATFNAALDGLIEAATAAKVPPAAPAQ